MQRYDVVIIGAGMSGLAAGIRLATYDQKVCILERHSLWGGLNSFYKRQGRQFDVGLHAMTNFARTGEGKGPLRTIARQLRLSIDQLQLREQNYSVVQFPGRRLRFENDLRVFAAEVDREFPAEADGFTYLCDAVRAHDDLSLEQEPCSAREVMGRLITSPVLIDMLLCPLLYYGSATEHDMDWNQFVIMFKSIFIEGLARPIGGVRTILRQLRALYLQRGGELTLRTGVERLAPLVEGGVVVHLDGDREAIRAERVLSSAGASETLRLLGRDEEARQDAGHMTFVETIFCLDREPRELDINSSVVFYNHREAIRYCRATELVDLDSGVLCCPNNFQDHEGRSEGQLRITNIASYEAWAALEGAAYEEAKARTIERQIESVRNVVPSFADHIVFTDSFTPKTIHRFTSHVNGAVYGSPNKRLTGEIGERDIFLCGTDQGYLGITGAMLSGILMANRHVLTKQ